jgi:enoyl-CoA hydratase/carnithine racemase
MTGRHVVAAEALAWGLVNEVVADGQALARAQVLAQELGTRSPLALRLDKTLIDSCAAMFDEQLAAESRAQAECVQTEEFRAAVAAFLSKRRSASRD